MTDAASSRRPPQTVLLATDLSSRCDRALDRAAQLAKAWEAQLIVVHVIDADEGRRRRAEEVPSWRRPQDARHLMGERVRRDLMEQLPDVEICIEEGNPADAIDAVARERGAELIVTGVARDETLGRVFLGATVERLVRRAAAPVLVVKSRARPYREIVVATDFSGSSQHALTAASAFFPQAGLTLLHAWEVPVAGFLDKGDFRDEFRASEQEACDRFLAASALSPDRLGKLKVLLEHGVPELIVRAYMNDHDVDLVVLGTHGRTRLFDIGLGGTAKRILDFSPGDVLLIPEPRARR